MDKNPAYPAAVEALKDDGAIPLRVALRQCKYNVIEQDHRTVKKRVWLAKGYGQDSQLTDMYWPELPLPRTSQRNPR